MLKLNINEVKNNLSRYLKLLQSGEVILLCKRNLPIAEIRPLKQTSKKARTYGMDKGKFVLGKEFFDPLPEEFLAHFRAASKKRV